MEFGSVPPEPNSKTTQNDDADVGGLDINNWRLYFRIFMAAYPVP
jgi:hypothetical protein